MHNFLISLSFYIIYSVLHPSVSTYFNNSEIQIINTFASNDNNVNDNIKTQQQQTHASPSSATAASLSEIQLDHFNRHAAIKGVYTSCSLLG